MSENLNDVVEEVVSDAEVMTVPIDDTLSVSGEAADAKAVGDALALKADASAVVDITVNGQGADNQGHIIVDASQIEMSSSDTTKVKAKIEAIDAKNATQIPMSSTAGAQSVAAAIIEQSGKNATNIPMSSASGAQTIAQKISTMDSVSENMATSIIALQSKAGDTIKMESGGTETIKEAVEKRVLTVNGDGPDATGNVQVSHALTADNLTSAASQNTVGEWVRRTSGGDASIQDGSAWLSSVRGNRVHVGYVPEVLNMVVSAAPRETGEPITATIDRDTFVAEVTSSSTINLYYTTAWSESPATYGVTVTGTPISGDQITITYVKEDRGTIIQSDPQSMVSTGYNLYNHEEGYAIGLKYSDTYGFYIGGTYTAVKYSSTKTGTKSTLTPADGYFSIPANGYIWVEGGNDTDTEVYMTWADWALGRIGDWEEYTEDVIDLSDIMEGNFPYGLLRTGDIRDEIDFNTGLAISRVQRLVYSAENLATAQASGRTYECDTNYIYLERASEVSTDIEIEGEYSVSDHGLEYFTDTDIAVYAINLYGNNLKNKLERDVVTKSQDVVNGFDSEATDKALSANAGRLLNSHLGSLIQTISISVDTNYYSKVTDSSFKIGNIVCINTRIKVNTVPTGPNIRYISFPSDVTLTSTGMVIPVYVGSEWGNPNTIAYGYVSSTGIEGHSSDLSAGKFIDIFYYGY